MAFRKIKPVDGLGKKIRARGEKIALLAKKAVGNRQRRLKLKNLMAIQQKDCERYLAML